MANYCLMRFTKLYDFYEKKNRITKNGKEQYKIHPSVKSVFNEMYRNTKTIKEDGIYDFNYRYGLSWNKAIIEIENAKNSHNKHVLLTHNGKNPVRKMKNGVSQCFAIDFSLSSDMNDKIDISKWQHLNNEFVEEMFLIYGCKLLCKNFKKESIVTMRYIILAWSDIGNRSVSSDFIKDRNNIRKCYDYYCEKMRMLGLEKAKKQRT